MTLASFSFFSGTRSPIAYVISYFFNVVNANAGSLSSHWPLLRRARLWKVFHFLALVVRVYNIDIKKLNKVFF